MRTIIIGDIHGCYHEFKALLKKVKYNSKKDRLVLLGDLMDRGPLSYEMLKWAIAWKKKHPDSFILIRGNHDQYIVEQSRDLDMMLIWMAVGKGATMRSFARHKDRMKRYGQWIKDNMQIAYKDRDFQCVHAAIEHENIEDNDLYRLVKDHFYAKENLYQGKLTIIGHIALTEPTYFDGSGQAGIPLAYRQWSPLKETGVICIDTGCVFGRKLTAMLIEDDKYYLDYIDSRVCVKNRIHIYMKWIKRLCSLPILRNFTSESEIE